MKRLYSMACVIAAGSLLLVPSAYADPKGHGKGSHDGKWEGKNRDKWEHERGHDDRGHDDRGGWDDGLNVTINIGDRGVIQHYLSDRYNSNCPPGLAKKHNGCLPPGQAKKRYVVGRPLPDGVFFQPISGDLLGHLQPVPYGYRYVRVDEDVLLISEASKHVIDAVTLLSAVGR